MNVRAMESAVLGGMLLSRDSLVECLDILSGQDFALAQFEAVFDACRSLSDEGKPVDVLTVADRLGPDLKRIGGLPLLHQLVEDCANPASAAYYAEKVRGAARLRTIGTVGTRLQQLSEDTDARYDDIDEVLEAARAELDAATGSAPDGPDELGVVVQEALDLYDREDGIPTPWTELNALLYRWEPGRLYVAGARPGVGKSVVGTCSALDCARRGKTAVVFSAEMSRAEVAQRLIANAGSVSLDRLVQRRLEDDDWRRIAEARRAIDRLPIVIDDRASLRMADIASVTRSLSRRRQIGLVVVDYVQLLQPPRHLVTRSREEQVGHAARSLKNLAKALHVPVLALAQLNRGSEHRQDKRPSMSDLRESGELEQAADVVMLLHRAMDNSMDPDFPPDELAVIVPKNRQGVTGGLALFWQGDYARASSKVRNW